MKTSGYLVTADHKKIHYDHYAGGHRKVIIIAHGFYNSKQSLIFLKMAKDLADDFDVIIFDFRGHGKSQGLFNWTSKEYLDLLAVITYAHAHYDKIGVIGFSLGAATTLITASKTTYINSIVAISTPSEVGKIDYRFWKSDFINEMYDNFLGQGCHGKGARPGPFWLKKEKPLDLVKKITPPILYIHGDKDWVIDHVHSEKLFKDTGSPKRLSIVPNGPHAENLFKGHSTELLKLITTWFHETI